MTVRRMASPRGRNVRQATARTAQHLTVGHQESFYCAAGGSLPQRPEATARRLPFRAGTDELRWAGERSGALRKPTERVHAPATRGAR